MGPSVPFVRAAAHSTDLPVEGVDHDGAAQDAEGVRATAFPDVEPGERLAGRDVVLVHGREGLEDLDRRFRVIQLEVYLRQQLVGVAGVGVAPVEGPGALERPDGLLESRQPVQRPPQRQLGVETLRMAGRHRLQVGHGQRHVPGRLESQRALEPGAALLGVFREGPVDVVHGHAEYGAHDLRGRPVLVVQIQHAPHRLESEAVHDVFHDDRGLVVGEDDLSPRFRPGETPVQLADGEQFPLDRRLREFRLQVHVPLRAGETRLVDGDTLRQPAGDAVARLLQVGDVDVLVPERLAPVERPLRPGLWRVGHHHFPEAHPEEAARPRHAGDTHHEVVVIRQDLDEHGSCRLETVPRRDRPVGLFEQVQGHLAVNGVFLPVYLQRETAALTRLEILEGIEQLQRIVRAGIEGVPVERLLQHPPSIRHLADPGQVDPQPRIGRRERGVGLDRPAAHLHGLPEPVAPREVFGDDLVEPAIGWIDREHARASRFEGLLPALAMIGGGQQGVGLRRFRVYLQGLVQLVDRLLVGLVRQVEPREEMASLHKRRVDRERLPRHGLRRHRLFLRERLGQADQERRIIRIGLQGFLEDFGGLRAVVLLHEEAAPRHVCVG